MQLTNEQKKAQKKLQHKIRKQFEKCTYIGDIPINDEEYDILIYFLKNICHEYLSSNEKYITSPVFAVALVQIGMRFYDGSYWPHVEDAIGIALSGPYQRWLGRSFFRTLTKYKKFHVEENEMVNNVLLHCFITEHYAADLFDFLFAYYQIDLERDLSRNNKDMRNYLMQSMEKGENTARAYKIKKHTSDAVSANERGCKIRVGKILRFMDNALFEGIYPTTSQNRIAQLFCTWANTSKKFDREKKALAGLNRRGEKRYSSPYLRFCGDEIKFHLVLPPQYVHLAEDENVPVLTWKVSYADQDLLLEVDAENCVTGCKTQLSDAICIPVEYLHESIRVELLKGEDLSLHRFTIPARDVRFFDANWNLIQFTDFLPDGQAFAFTKANELLVSDGNAIFDCNTVLGLDLYSLELTKGEILRLPSGRAVSVGKALDEGLQQAFLISGAYVMDREQKLALYSAVPSLFFKMNPSQEKGTLITVNGKPYRFDIEKAIKCSTQNKADEKGYILRISEYIATDGIYRVVVDIPNSRKTHEYVFAVIHEFSFEYENAPYIFKETGHIHFSESTQVYGDECCRPLPNNTFLFEIPKEKDYIPFQVKTAQDMLDLRVYLPVFKWKFDDGNWNILPPEQIWHTEFPKCIYFKFPDDSVKISMPPLLLQEASDDVEYDVTVLKNKESHMFICDTRKMLSWFGFEEVLRPLSIQFESVPSFVFADVVTRCYIPTKQMEIIEDRKWVRLWFKCSVVGFSDCVADIYLNNELIQEKTEVYANGIKTSLPFISGTYKVDFFETDDDDDFGEIDYRKFATKTCKLKSKYDMTNKSLVIKEVIGRKKSSTIFAPANYPITTKSEIIEIVPSTDEANMYMGMFCENGISQVKVKFKISDIDTMHYAEIWFWDEDDQIYTEFLYDTQKKTIVLMEDATLSSIQSRKRYIQVFSDDYYFGVQVK